MGSGHSRKAKVEKLDPSKPLSAPTRRSDSATRRRKPLSADLIAIKERKAQNASSALVGGSRPHSSAPVSAIHLKNQRAISQNSVDSGIGNDSREDSAKSAAKVASQSSSGSPNVGSTSLPSLNAALTKAPPADDKKIIASLRQEGLLDAPSTNTSKGGLVYEVPLGDLQPQKRDRPPVRLQKMEERRKQMELTRQQLKEKLDQAQKRRKQREHEKVERSREKDAKNLEVKLALMDFERTKERRRWEYLQMNQMAHAEKREQALTTVIDRQRERDERQDDVRQRKLSNQQPPPAIRVNDAIELGLTKI